MMKKILSLSLAILLFTACDKVPAVQGGFTLSSGVVVLNQGAWNGNNASLSFIDDATRSVTLDFFRQVNGLGIGSNAIDVKSYQGKLFISISDSKVVQVLSATTGMLLGNIPVEEPRQLCCLNGKVYVTLYDGHVARIDATSLQVEKTISVGLNPEGIVSVGNRLFVANSGGLNFTESIYDNRISVIDIPTFEVTDEITSVINPRVLVVDAQQRVWLVALGNYGTVSASLQQIDPVTLSITTIAGVSPSLMAVHGDKAYIVSTAYDANWNPVNAYSVLNLTTQKIENSAFIDGSAIVSPLSIAIDPRTEDIYIADAVDYVNGGDVIRYNASGVLLQRYAVGVVPCGFLFIP